MTTDTQRIYYVYLLMDPARKGIDGIFYVGKGKNRRAEDHLKGNPKKEGEKHKKIQEIERRGQKVKIEILRHHLTEDEALEVESSTIDLIGIENLTNIQYGHYKNKKGRNCYSKTILTGTEEVTDAAWKELEKQGALLLNLAESYSWNLTAQELYDAARGWWNIAEQNRKNIKYVLAVHNGVVQEIYEPVGWFKAGLTMLNKTPNARRKDFWEFVGHIATDNIRKKYYKKSLFKRIKLGQWIFRYVPLGGIK